MATVGRKDVLISDNDNRTPKNNSLELEGENEANIISQDMDIEERENTGDRVKRRRQKKRKRKLKQASNGQEENTPVEDFCAEENATEIEVICTENQDTTNSPRKENTEVKLFCAEENATETEVICTENQDTTNSPQKNHKKNSVEKRASCIVLCLKGLIMFAAVVLISSSENISKAKSCDLEKALTSINLNYNFPCKHHAIKDDSSTLRYLGIALLAVNCIFFLLILIFPLLLPICKLLVRTFNYVQLQSNLTIWLEKHYTSDNISSGDVISNSWNKFFIEYDCCAINQVQGTTNDFDSTPWCTTVGSCQATASQIPKTCCNYMSEDDYESALPDCHSSVNPGTFRSNCMNVIKQLSVVNIEECHLSLLQMSLIIIGTLELIFAAYEIMGAIVLFCVFCFFCLYKLRSKTIIIKEKDL